MLTMKNQVSMIFCLPVLKDDVAVNQNLVFVSSFLGFCRPAFMNLQQQCKIPAYSYQTYKTEPPLGEEILTKFENRSALAQDLNLLSGY